MVKTFEDSIIENIISVLGMPGFKKLVHTLSGKHNNWQVAKDFGLTIFQVTVCNQLLIKLCHTVLTEDLKQSNKQEYPNVFPIQRAKRA